MDSKFYHTFRFMNEFQERDKYFYFLKAKNKNLLNTKIYKKIILAQLENQYRKLPLKNTGDTLKGPDGTVLVTAHWVF